LAHFVNEAPSLAGSALVPSPPLPSSSLSSPQAPANSASDRTAKIAKTLIIVSSPGVSSPEL
jgi:hypothetical protein